MPIEKVLEALGSGFSGLSESEASSRLRRYGLNEIKEARGKPLSWRFAANLTNPMALLLWVASVMAYIGSMPQLAWAIVGVVMVNAAFSFWQEYRAERTAKELKKLIPQHARVIRDGAERQVPAQNIVPGDLVVISEGDRIPADGRVIKNFRMLTDESALTGESRPVAKTSQPIFLRTKTSPYRLPNLVFGGTNLVSGSGVAVIFATGMKTQFGRIAHLTEAVEEEQSPLQKELRRVTATVTLFAVLLGITIFLVSLSLGLAAAESFLFAIGMIVANVPEGLLPTVTLSLAISMQRMAKRRAVIKRLSSVETLGCTTVICTDKTGTLTCNEMTVTHVWVGGLSIRVTGTGYNPQGSFLSATTGAPVENNPDLQLLLTIAITCNDARLVPPTDQNRRWSVLGDPTEGALLVAALKADIPYPPLTERVTVLPFESKRKRMSVVVSYAGAGTSPGPKHLRAYVKGAPAELLDLSTTILKGGRTAPLDDLDKEIVRRQIDSYARDGLRVLGLAYRDLGDHTSKLTPDTVECELTFAGLVAMTDPPRPEVEEAIRRCKQAGIRVLMLTGDYGLTAESVARKLGIITGRARVVTGEEVESLSDEGLQKVLSEENIVFARINPEHKLRIVMGLQALNHIVAMTGDGVNDAPALKRADIGVAMGISGTDVAKEAADIIITDDNFTSIVNAVEEGRAVYNNIKKFTKYIFASNVPEIVPFVLFALANVPLALNVMQILSVDLGTDMVPALALGAEPPEEDVMRLPPRRRGKSILSTSLLAQAFLFLGAIEAVAAMTSYYWMNIINGYSLSSPAQPGTPVYLMATTMTLVGIVMAQVGNVFACRTERSSSLKRSIRINPLLPLGLVFELSIILSLVYLPFLHPIFGTAPLLPHHWLLPLAFAPTILLADEVRKLIVRRRNRLTSSFEG
ncbi:cation-transporting P-type ATPase [Candidatus Bathyarchaeota archaeon]|nr:cation-transporting P-type ATPase [Candidatus Bathyarchaeota archaeon]